MKILPAFAALFLCAVLTMEAEPGKVVDAAASGVVGDGKTLNTEHLQKVIDGCSAAGGGTVVLSAGRYLTGTVQLKSGVTLRLEKGATLLGSADAADYRNVDPFTDGSGQPMGHALVAAVDAENVGIEGAGTVDGQSPALKAAQKPYAVRPFLVRLVRCRNVAVRGVRLTNPGAWTLNLFQTKGAVVEDVTIRCRGLGMSNNDGIDLDSCVDVRVSRCDVVSGDDALVIKATSAGQPSRGIAASDCKLSSGCNAIKLGTESIGGFADVAVSRCQVTDTGLAGVALYTVDGGDLHGVAVSDISMDGVAAAVSIRLGARLKTFRAGDKPKAVGRLYDVALRNVTARRVGLIGMLINGLPGHPAEGLTFENIQIELPGGGTAEGAGAVVLPENESAYPEINMFGRTLPAAGMYVRHVRGARFVNVRMSLVKPDGRPVVVLVDAEGVVGL